MDKILDKIFVTMFSLWADLVRMRYKNSTGGQNHLGNRAPEHSIQKLVKALSSVGDRMMK